MFLTLCLGESIARVDPLYKYTLCYIAMSWWLLMYDSDVFTI